MRAVTSLTPSLTITTDPTRPENICRMIENFDRKGIASFDGRRIQVPDLDLLLDVCGQQDLF